ncbi:cytochrome C [Methylobacterium sp. Leaf456]|uniref:c-type cytochrome n=1 Tax=Methylobacterium sp. Leaf456 TaxID=1736382 RepID=UPI0025700807|nr:cytochrome C [Methylobacterium sp. Leaf456]
MIRAALAMAATAVPLVPAAGADPLAPGAASCLACHAEGGGLPDLGTLSPQAIEAALAGYRDGSRAGTVMPRLAKGFSAVESRAIAEALGRTGAAGR